MKKDQILYIIIVLLVAAIVIMAVSLAQKNTNEEIEATGESTATIDINIDNANTITGEEEEMDDTNKVAANTAQIYLAVGSPEGQTCLDGTNFISQEVTFEPTVGVLRASLNALINFDDSELDEQIVNAALGNDLAISFLDIQDGLATIKFTTTQPDALQTFGCEQVWFVNQVFRTAIQFPSVTTAEIFINGVSLEV